MIDMSGDDLPQHAQALEAAKCGDYGRARTLLSQLPDGPPWTLVRADPDVFRYRRQPPEAEDEERYGMGWQISPRLLVVTPDQERSTPALERTVGRFMDIIEDGRELADWEYRGDASTPSYASLSMTDAGPLIYADTQGVLTPERGYAMLRVLADELIAEKVRALIAYPTTEAVGLASSLCDSSDPAIIGQPTCLRLDRSS
jgi:hypothetical protein